MTTLSAMGLLNLLHKSANADINLLASEIRLLSVLITYGNEERYGYESWPSTDTLVYKTGLSERTLERAKKSLVKGDWIVIQSGKREGKSNHYFINARKIVCAYNKCNPKHTAMPEALSRLSEPHVNRADNSANLVQNKVAVVDKPSIVKSATLVNPLDGTTITKKFRRNGDVLLLDSFPPDVGLFEHNMWTDEERSEFVGEVAA